MIGEVLVNHFEVNCVKDFFTSFLTILLFRYSSAFVEIGLFFSYFFHSN